RLDGFMEFPRDIFAAMLLSPLGAAKAAEKSLATDLEYSTRTYRHTQRPGRVLMKTRAASLIACITPIGALVRHSSRCSFAHSLKASTIASFDTIDFGHAEGIDVVVKSGGTLLCFNARPFLKT